MSEGQYPTCRWYPIGTFAHDLEVLSEALREVGRQFAITALQYGHASRARIAVQSRGGTHERFCLAFSGHNPGRDQHGISHASRNNAWAAHACWLRGRIVCDSGGNSDFACGEGVAMTNTIPFLAIGNDELGDPLGDTVTCPHCGAEHAVIHSESIDADGNVIGRGALAYYRCGDASYFAGIGGRAWNNTGESE